MERICDFQKNIFFVPENFFLKFKGNIMLETRFFQISKIKFSEKIFFEMKKLKKNMFLF